MAAMYSRQVIDHFQNPRNVGELPDSDVIVRVENPACGDLMQLALRVKDGVITEARYKIRGCTTSIACGSALTEMIIGKTLAQAGEIQREDIADALGGLTNETRHGSHLAIDALHKALELVLQGSKP